MSREDVPGSRRSGEVEPVPGVTLGSAIGWDLPRLCDLFTASFEGYFVPITFTPTTFAQRLLSDGVDLGRSRIVELDGEPVGLALIGCRGWQSRLAAMALVPGARSRGIGRWLVDVLLEEARAIGERAMVLEVIEENVAGVTLYRGAGFCSLGRLVGYVADAPPGQRDRALREVDPHHVARIAAETDADLPWPIAFASLCPLGPPHRAFVLGEAVAVVTDPTADVVWVRSLAVRRDQRGRGWGTRMLCALAAELEPRTWRVSAVVPERAGRVFERSGYRRELLTQLWMRCELAPPVRPARTSTEGADPA